MWLPPGGHIEPNEDPVQAVLREAREETGLEAQLLPAVTPFRFCVPKQLQPPVTILVEDIHDPAEGFHQHIDSIYFLALQDDDATPSDGWRWVTKHELEAAVPIQTPSGEFIAPPEDVQEVGRQAIARFRAASGPRGGIEGASQP